MELPWLGKHEQVCMVSYRRYEAVNFSKAECENSKLELPGYAWYIVKWSTSQWLKITQWLGLPVD